MRPRGPPRWPGAGRRTAILPPPRPPGGSCRPRSRGGRTTPRPPVRFSFPPAHRRCPPPAWRPWSPPGGRPRSGRSRSTGASAGWRSSSPRWRSRSSCCPCRRCRGRRRPSCSRKRPGWPGRAGRACIPRRGSSPRRRDRTSRSCPGRRGSRGPPRRRRRSGPPRRWRRPPCRRRRCRCSGGRCRWR